MARMPHPAQIVVFGATGDLMHRKLAPALARLAGDPGLREPFSVIGVARSERSDEAFRASLRDALAPAARQAFDALAPRVYYQRADASQPASMRALRDRLDALAHGARTGRLFYLSLAPRLFGATVAALSAEGLLDMREGERTAWRR